MRLHFCICCWYCFSDFSFFDELWLQTHDLPLVTESDNSPASRSCLLARLAACGLVVGVCARVNRISRKKLSTTSISILTHLQWNALIALDMIQRNNYYDNKLCRWWWFLFKKSKYLNYLNYVVIFCAWNLQKPSTRLFGAEMSFSKTITESFVRINTLLTIRIRTMPVKQLQKDCNDCLLRFHIPILSE